MPRRLPPVNWLRAFEAAARHVSFTQAARELGVTPSAVSQQVRLLEQHLGCALFNRLPRSLELAEAGEAYLPLVHDAFERLVASTAELFGDRGVKRLTIRVTAGFAVFWLIPRLTRFRARHPDMALRLTTSIWAGEPRDPAADLEIRHGAGGWPGMRAERLSWDTVFPVCSPSLRNGPVPLVSPADLSRHTLLHAIGFREGWGEWLARAGVADRVDPAEGLEFDTSVMTIELALRGAGVALGRSCLVGELLAAGRLVAPFELALPTDEAVYLISTAGRPADSAAERFRVWLLAEAGKDRPRAAGSPRRTKR